MVTVSFLVASDRSSRPQRDLGLGERYGHYLLHHICVARFPVLEADYLADYYHNRGTLLLELISTCYTQLYSTCFNLASITMDKVFGIIPHLAWVDPFTPKSCGVKY